ncbi:restriction endonuclease subunit M [Bombilactobacillus bombi]|uniref:site-specific DNA-methyltransferase (adenine-specific) n=1 Tax=Bombilactobacillus bombi TaxID=1303590 RepID=A0A3R6V5Y9_9LACO|nr:restriction endonuclease subunit M [Bombilactobacillus bombi]
MSKTTEYFFKQLGRSEQKKIGQFTTPIQVAEYMAERLINNAVISSNHTIKILDPGSGTGILGLAVVEKLFTLFPQIHVELIAYENDPIALKVLKYNLRLVKDWSDKNKMSFSYDIRERNYILEDEELINDSAYLYRNSYDLIIANPPYKKLSKNSLEANAMNFIVHGAPNIYGLFWAKSIIELKPKATSAFIIPRSWMSGAYFERLRKFVFSMGSIIELHAFGDRNNIFGSTKVLQELVIVIFQKQKTEIINVWAHDDIKSLNESNPLIVPKHLAIVGSEQRVYLITNTKEIAIARWAESLPSTFIKSGLKMKTGLTVCFRNRELIEDKETDFNVPIFYSDNFENHRIKLKRKNGQYLSTKRPGLLQDNIDYIFIKRFSSKEEARRIQTAFYDSQQFSNKQKISTDNKLNFVIAESNYLLRGAFIVLSSTIFDDYYRLLSGNTQVNSTEINSMKFPSKNVLYEIGYKYSVSQLINMKQDKIDQIVFKMIGGRSDE